MKEYYLDYENVVVELDECPFCGADPEVRRVGGSSYSIRCSNRPCMAEQAVYSTLNEAAMRWNTRVK